MPQYIYINSPLPLSFVLPRANSLAAVANSAFISPHLSPKSTAVGEWFMCDAIMFSRLVRGRKTHTQSQHTTPLPTPSFSRVSRLNISRCNLWAGQVGLNRVWKRWFNTIVEKDNYFLTVVILPEALKSLALDLEAVILLLGTSWSLHWGTQGHTGFTASYWSNGFYLFTD